MNASQLDLYDPLDHARVTDPATSKAAAATVSAPHRRALLDRLEAAFRTAPAGLTAEEAADLAGVDPWAASKRVSDLVRAGLVVDTGRTRPGRSGRTQRVLAHHEVAP